MGDENWESISAPIVNIYMGYRLRYNYQSSHMCHFFSSAYQQPCTWELGRVLTCPELPTHFKYTEN